MAHSHAQHAAKPNPVRRLWALIVAIAMLVIVPAGAMTATAADPVSGVGTVTGSHMKLTLTRTDSLGDTPAVGSRLTYTLGYQNLTSNKLTAYPTASTLSGVIDKQAGKVHPVCRFTMNANQSGECKTNGTNNYVTHVVTEADKTNGFTPSATVIASSDADNPTGNNILETLTVTADTVYKPAETTKSYLKMTLTRTDKLGDSVSVGATLTYDISYENVGDQKFTVYPTASNLSGVLDASATGHPVCRWRDLETGTTKGCSGKATHVVTEADKTAGGFTPTFTAVATTNADAKPTDADTLETVTATGAKVTVSDSTPDPDPTPDPNAKYLTVTATRVDNLGENLAVGSKIRYKFDYTNVSDQQITVYPKDSNLTNTDVMSTDNCRIRDLAAKGTSKCDSDKLAYHVVGAEDIIKGTFTPTALFQATEDNNGTKVLQDNIVIDFKPITIKAQSKDEASTAKAYKDGESRYLAKARQFGANESYRIPAVATGKNGRILAAWDLRPVGGDAPQPNSIVMRYSDDQGKSWSDLKMVAQGRNTGSRHGYSDPSFVVDEETGTIFLFFVKSYNQGYAGSQVGVDPNNRNVLQAAITKSTDNGETWSEPQIITDQVTKGHEQEWKSRFATSGAGIQLKYGTHKGRLIQQFAVKPTTGSISYAVSIYSDDHGATWKVGGVISSTNMDENKVVELSNGDVMVNARPGTAGYRKVAISKDGGETYGEVKNETQLPDPNNNAHIMRAYPDAPEGSAKAKILLFSSPQANNVGRKNGVIRISFDDGKTWSAGKLYKSDSMAYSVMTVLDDGSYGLLYEGDWISNGVDSHEIMYMPFSMAWLGYLDVTATAEAASVAAGTTTVTVPVTVKNNSSDDYTSLTVKAADLPAGWSAADARVADGLAAGKSTTVNVTLTLPESAKKGDKITGKIKVTGTYANGVNVSATGTTPMDSDTLTAMEDGSLTVNVTEGTPDPDPDPDPEPTEPTIASIGASLKAGDGKYVVGDPFAGVTVTAFMSDGTERELAADDVTVTGSYFGEGGDVDLTKPFERAGEVQIVVRLKADPSKEDTFTVTVAEKTPVTPEPTEPTVASIKATAQTEYKVDETFAGLKVVATMSDKSTKELAAGEYTVKATDEADNAVDLAKPFGKAGTFRVTVASVDNAKATDTFTVTVAEKAVTPDPDPTPGPSVPGLSDLTESNRVAGLVPVDSMVAGGRVTLHVGSAHAGRVVVVFLDSAGVVRSRGNVAVGADGLVEAIAPEIAGSYRVAVSTAGGALLWDVVSVTAKAVTPAPKPTPAPTSPSKRPAVADTGASVAVVALAAVALAAAAGGVVLARRRA